MTDTPEPTPPLKPGYIVAATEADATQAEAWLCQKHRGHGAPDCVSYARILPLLDGAGWAVRVNAPETADLEAEVSEDADRWRAAYVEGGRDALPAAVDEPNPGEADGD